MKQYIEEKFTGERALFQSNQLDIRYCTFEDGESPLKESRDLNIEHTLFKWKYPLWYSHHVTMKDSVLFDMARAGIWYSSHLKLEDVTIEAPKTFRRCQNLSLTRVTMPDASETLWNCSFVKMKDVTAKGSYFAMGCSDMEIDGLTLVGDYSFDGVRNLTIRNSKLLSKDAFWNCENVTVYDSFISGEYLGWNASNVRLVNCTIESLQGMCYMENVVLENCRLLNTNLAFEYSTVQASICGNVESVKNPYGGTIEADSFGEVIFDNAEMMAENTTIITREEKVMKAV